MTTRCGRLVGRRSIPGRVMLIVVTGCHEDGTTMSQKREAAPGVFRPAGGVDRGLADGGDDTRQCHAGELPPHGGLGPIKDRIERVPHTRSDRAAVTWLMNPEHRLILDSPVHIQQRHCRGVPAKLPASPWSGLGGNQTRAAQRPENAPDHHRMRADAASHPSRRTPRILMPGARQLHQNEEMNRHGKSSVRLPHPLVSSLNP
jgi:hypothetical protein